MPAPKDVLSSVLATTKRDKTSPPETEGFNPDQKVDRTHGVAAGRPS